MSKAKSIAAAKAPYPADYKRYVGSFRGLKERRWAEKGRLGTHLHQFAPFPLPGGKLGLGGLHFDSSLHYASKREFCTNQARLIFRGMTDRKARAKTKARSIAREQQSLEGPDASESLPLVHLHRDWI